jgi:hypothetical protein
MMGQVGAEGREELFSFQMLLKPVLTYRRGKSWEVLAHKKIEEWLGFGLFTGYSVNNLCIFSIEKEERREGAGEREKERERERFNLKYEVKSYMFNTPNLTFSTSWPASLGAGEVLGLRFHNPSTHKHTQHTTSSYFPLISCTPALAPMGIHCLPTPDTEPESLDIQGRSHHVQLVPSVSVDT